MSVLIKKKVWEKSFQKVKKEEGSTLMSLIVGGVITVGGRFEKFKKRFLNFLDFLNFLIFDLAY